MTARDHHGLYADEQRVMDLHDAGTSRADIVAQLGLSENRVRWIISMFSVQQDRQFAGFVRMLRAGSQELAYRLALTGKRFL